MAHARSPTYRRNIQRLMAQQEWDAARNLLLTELAKAERLHERALLAQHHCCTNLGNATEALGHVGEAFRWWSRALALLSQLGLSETAEAFRLRSIIELWHEAPRVWVTYAHEDGRRVKRILRALREADVDIVFDGRFVAGHSIQRQILAAIARCPKGIVFWSRASERSGWVRYESDLLRQRRKDISAQALDNIVIFYCLDDAVPKEDFPDDLRIIEPKIGFAEATKRLVRSLKTSEILAEVV